MPLTRQGTLSGLASSQAFQQQHGPFAVGTSLRTPEKRLTCSKEVFYENKLMRKLLRSIAEGHSDFCFSVGPARMLFHWLKLFNIFFKSISNLNRLSQHYKESTCSSSRGERDLNNLVETESGWEGGARLLYTWQDSTGAWTDRQWNVNGRAANFRVLRRCSAKGREDFCHFGQGLGINFAITLRARRCQQSGFTVGVSFVRCLCSTTESAVTLAEVSRPGLADLALYYTLLLLITLYDS